MLITKQLLVRTDSHSMEKNTKEVNGDQKLFVYPHYSKYLLLCSAEERNSYRFGTTLGWVNDDSIFIFGWIIPLTKHMCKAKTYTKYLSVCSGLYSSWWLHKDVPLSLSCFESWDFAVASSTWAEIRSWISFTIVSTVALLNSSMKSANSFWNTKDIKRSHITISCVSKQVRL